MLITGALKLLNLPDLQCVNNLTDALLFLAKNLVIELPDSITNVVVSNQEPTDANRDTVWFKRNDAGQFVGIFVFSNGSWIQMFPMPHQIFKAYGDSSTPDPGYELITTSTPGFSAADVARLQTQWQRDPTDAFWTIFETIYTGLQV